MKTYAKMAWGWKKKLLINFLYNPTNQLRSNKILQASWEDLAKPEKVSQWEVLSKRRILTKNSQERKESMSLLEFFQCSAQHAYRKSWRILRGRCATLRIRLQFSNCGSEQELRKKFNENIIWYKCISLLKFTEFPKFLTFWTWDGELVRTASNASKNLDSKALPRSKTLLQGSGEQRPRPLPRPDAVLPLNRLTWYSLGAFIFLLTRNRKY